MGCSPNKEDDREEDSDSDGTTVRRTLHVGSSIVAVILFQFLGINSQLKRSEWLGFGSDECRSLGDGNSRLRNETGSTGNNDGQKKALEEGRASGHHLDCVFLFDFLIVDEKQ